MQNEKISHVETMRTLLHDRYGHLELTTHIQHNELTVEVANKHLRTLCFALRDEQEFKFEQLMDICGVDYLQYGLSEWVTSKATETGFERAVTREEKHGNPTWHKPRFAVVYHLLSVSLNQRIALRVFAEGEPPAVDSVVDIWASANWNEREAFDLYGIIFHGHPDLRRILTDYGFAGHPFRKDFPLVGDVEMRYDADEGRVIYEAVSIEPRVLVPRVIRNEHQEGN